MEPDRLTESRLQRWLEHHLRDLIRLLADNERLGEPVRDDDRIIFPVLGGPTREARPNERETESLHRLFAAWFE